MQDKLKSIEELKPWEFLKKYCHPWLGAEVDYPDLFGKYGMTYCGIGISGVGIQKKTLTF